jgi:ketol-acid reductoisomerase
MTPLFKKLNLTTQTEIVVLNAPDSFGGEVAALEGVTVRTTLRKGAKTGFAIGFAITEAELERVSTAMVSAADGDAILWIAYPKQSSKRYRCEFNRDSGWTVLAAAGFETVRMVAIDEDWSALRFRRTQFVRTITRTVANAVSPEGKRRARKG